MLHRNSEWCNTKPIIHFSILCPLICQISSQFARSPLKHWVWVVLHIWKLKCKPPCIPSFTTQKLVLSDNSKTIIHFSIVFHECPLIFINFPTIFQWCPLNFHSFIIQLFIHFAHSPLKFWVWVLVQMSKAKFNQDFNEIQLFFISFPRIFSHFHWIRFYFHWFPLILHAFLKCQGPFDFHENPLDLTHPPKPHAPKKNKHIFIVRPTIKQFIDFLWISIHFQLIF